MEAQNGVEIDVSIVLPCLNEELSLPRCIEWSKEALVMLEKEGLSGEIVISDNGSTDRSRELAREMGCRVVDCPRRGYGHAIVEGAKQAGGRYIVMGDSDGSYDFREGVPMVLKLHREGYDLFNGNRFTGTILPGAMPWKNQHIGNPVLSGILNLIYRSGLGDAHCGLRAFTREAFLRMNICTGGMEFASEIIIKAALLEMKCGEMPITLHKDCRNRPPNLRPFRDGFRHLGVIFTYAPGWVFDLPAAVFFMLGILIAAAAYLVTPYTSGIGLFAIGVQSVLLGVLGWAGGTLARAHGVCSGLWKTTPGIARRMAALNLRNAGPSLLSIFISGMAFLLLGMDKGWHVTLFGLLLWQIVLVLLTAGFLLQLILDRPSTGDRQHGEETKS